MSDTLSCFDFRFQEVGGSVLQEDTYTKKITETLCEKDYVRVCSSCVII